MYSREAKRDIQEMILSESFMFVDKLCLHTAALKTLVFLDNISRVMEGKNTECNSYLNIKISLSQQMCCSWI